MPIRQFGSIIKSTDKNYTPFAGNKRIPYFHAKINDYCSITTIYIIFVYQNF
jgi:hypothetical protein